MKHRKILRFPAILLAAALLLTGCGTNDSDSSAADGGSDSSAAVSSATYSALDTADMFTDRDLSGS